MSQGEAGTKPPSQRCHLFVSVSLQVAEDPESGIIPYDLLLLILKCYHRAVRYMCLSSSFSLFMHDLGVGLAKSNNPIRTDSLDFRLI